MVDIKEGINIGQSRCLGVAPGRTESEIICSFCNGLIAIYSVSTNLYYFCVIIIILILVDESEICKELEIERYG